MNLLLALFLIVFEALYEGQRNKTISGIIEFIYRAMITIIAFAFTSGVALHWAKDTFLVSIIGYIFLRFALFDFVYNLSAGLPIGYIGKTKLFDRALRWLSDYPSIYWFLKGIAAFWGITWLLGGREGLSNIF